MKAVKMTNTKIVCDSCHHEFAGNIEEWHRKPCPQCGAPDIITDRDLESFRGLCEMVDEINAMLGPPDQPATAQPSRVTLTSKDVEALLAGRGRR